MVLSLVHPLISPYPQPIVFQKECWRLSLWNSLSLTIFFFLKGIGNKFFYILLLLLSSYLPKSSLNFSQSQSPSHPPWGRLQRAGRRRCPPARRPQGWGSAWGAPSPRRSRRHSPQTRQLRGIERWRVSALVSVCKGSVGRHAWRYTNTITEIKGTLVCGKSRHTSRNR